MPKLNLDEIQVKKGSIYPGALNDIVKERCKQKIGDAGGLQQFGVNLTQIPPGYASAHRHWHANEDELIFIVSGEGILIEDDGEAIMKAGDAATFRAGVPNGHHILNRSDEMLIILEVGTRCADEDVTYTQEGVDLKISKRDHQWQIMRKDGSKI